MEIPKKVLKFLWIVVQLDRYGLDVFHICVLRERKHLAKEWRAKRQSAPRDSEDPILDADVDKTFLRVLVGRCRDELSCLSHRMFWRWSGAAHNIPIG